MKAARFAAKYAIVRDLKIEPVVVYRLAADRCRFTPDQFEAVFAAAKDRWISWKDVLQAADGAQTVHAGPIDPDAEEPAEAIESTADIPDEIEGRLDRFDAAMRLMLEVATMPAASFVTATYQPATPAHDIEKVGDFLKTLAGAMTEQALDMAA